MPRDYWYHCDVCDYRAMRYRNVKRCKCGGNLIREEPRPNPNRVVIELDEDGPVCVRAARPDEALVIIRHVKPRFGEGQLVYGDGGLPIEPLAVVGEEARFEVAE